MNDTYSKIMLTVIAAALCVNAFQNMNLVNPAFAASNQVHKIAICRVDGSQCVGVRGNQSQNGGGWLMVPN